jgi:Uma2 family endonuclease
MSLESSVASDVAVLRAAALPFVAARNHSAYRVAPGAPDRVTIAFMGTMTAAISAEEYLATSYPDGDREYLDGQVSERNMGEYRHGRLQAVIASWLLVHYPQFWTVVETRFRITRSRYRIPDVCLGPDTPPESGPILAAPFLAIEIVSPDDRVGDMQDRIDDYLGAGVKYIWVINPMSRRAHIHTADGIREVKDGILRTENPAIEVPLSELFK